MATRSCSRLLIVTEKALSPGVNFWASSNGWDFLPPRSWVIGDGSLGFWVALEEEYGQVAQQRCWVHKTLNILDKMPKSVQGKARQLITKCTCLQPGKRLWQLMTGCL